MGRTVSYEVYAFKGGNWNIDSVYDEKEMALFEARALLDSRHLSGVQVIEERFDAETGETLSKIVFKARKGQDRKPTDRPPVRRSIERAAAAAPKPRKKPAKDDNFTKYVTLLVLTVGGIGLGLIAVLAFLLEVMG